LRYENSRIIINDSINKQTQIFAPNAGISWTINNFNKINIGYDNFITRPTIWQLNPFIYFSDSLNISGGNPYLLPEVKNNIEIKHSYIKKGKQIFGSFFYGWSNNLIDNLTSITSTGQSFESYSNVSKNKNVE
jgi:outer membrane receptor protein involved in Fe transport